MTRLELATPLRRTRRYEQATATAASIDMRRTLRASLRTGGDPIRLARRRRRIARRRLVMLCDISGSMEPYARAYLQFLTCAAGSGPDAEAFVFATRLTRLTRALALAQPRARDPARRRRGAGLVERDPDRRGAEGLQRPPRPPRHGARRRGRDPLRRLGARRPELVGREMARLAPPRAPDRLGQPAGRASGFSVAAGGMVAALPYCDALVSGHSFEALERGRRGDRERAGPPRPAPRRGRRRPTGEARSRGRSATPVAGSSVAMPSGYGPARGSTTPGWSERDDERPSAAGGKTCIYPGCERPAVPPHPLGGPQPSFCDLEEHNALTAHQERQRLASASARDTIGASERGGDPAVANEAYRAVFLRVHPTGKMVLSLTTRVRRQGGAVRPDRRRRARRAGARRQGRRRPTPTASASATATTRARPPGRRRRSSAPPARSATRRSCSRARRSRSPPESLRWDNGAWVAGAAATRSSRRSRTSPSTRTAPAPLPPGVEGGLDAQTVYRD